MEFRQNNKLRIISTIVLALFIWSFGGGLDIAYAIKSSQSLNSTKSKKKEKKPEEIFQDTLNEIEAVLKDKAIDKDTKKNKLKLKKKDIENLDGELTAQFTATEDKIKDLPEVIQKRHQEFVKHYQDNLKELRKNLDAIDKAKTNKEIEAEIEKTKAFLEKVKPTKKHTPLDPNKLPHRPPEKKEVQLEERKFEPKKFKLPKLRKKKAAIGEEGFLEDFLVEDEGDLHPESFMVASAGSLNNLFAQAEGEPAPKHTPPTDADLAETAEIQFTPAITAKAEELEKNPVKIYNWVKNNIEFVPTYGSIQGADMCLKTKLCNAFDTASLAIALLRASNIHARYVTGTVEIPMDRFMNWAGGFTDPMSALSLFASSGIPITGMTVGGQIKYAKLEHVWVEAWIDYFPYRGARHRTGQGDMWTIMETSYKQYNYTQGMDIQSAVPFDAEALINQLDLASIVNEEGNIVNRSEVLLIQQNIQEYQTQVENYINQNYPDATISDVLGKKEIITKEFPFIPGTLQFRTISRDAIYAEIPSNLRHKINFNVIKDIYDPVIGTPLNITKSLPELAGKKITLSYAPATPEDEGIINSYLPEPHEDGSPITPEELPSSLPAYLISVKPELKIDGEVVATGSAVGLGMTEDFKMTFSGPGLNANDVIKNDVQAGEFYGIALNLGRISQEQMQELKTELETTKTKLETKDFTGLTKDDVLGDLLYSTALSYHAEFDVMDHVQAKTMGLTAIRFPSEAHFSTELSVYSIFGTPMSVSANGMAMDVDRIMTMVKSLDGDLEKPIQFYLSSGANGSALEHSVPEQLFSTAKNPAEGISAVKALQIATDQGIPIYTINQSNIETIVPQLQVDSDTIIDIQNAVNAGMEVTVQQSDITYNGWTGHGYIVINPTTGAGAYMIAGGMSGAIIFVFLLLMNPVFLINVLFIALILDNSEIILDSLKKIFGTVVETINIYSCFPNPMLMFIPNLYCLSHYGEDAVKQYYECLNDIFMDFLAAEVIQETTLLTLIAYLGLEIGTKVAKKIFFIWELYSTPQDIYAFGKCNYDLTTGN